MERFEVARVGDQQQIPLPPTAQAAVTDDAAQPPGKGAWFLEPEQRHVGLREGLLGSVLGVVYVTQQRIRVGEGQAVVCVNQGRECRGVAGLRLPDQLSLVPRFLGHAEDRCPRPGDLFVPCSPFLVRGRERCRPNLAAAPTTLPSRPDVMGVQPPADLGGIFLEVGFSGESHDVGSKESVIVMSRWKLWPLRVGLGLFRLGLHLAGKLPGLRYPRFLTLDSAAKRAVERRDYDRATLLARELLSLADAYGDDWNHGNALHHGHLVLGRVALAAGDVPTARAELLLAGQTPGSPQLDSFGPNMRLARDLLRAGEREVVLQYFALCRRFWKMGVQQLAQWTADAEQGRVPNFGPNLFY
jgi:hypothetical protein